MKKIIFAAAAIALSGAAFAQTSNTNKVTAGLIDDEIVDNLDTGAEDVNALAFVGYDIENKQAEIGAGKQFNSLWFSAYDAYRFEASETDSESAQTDSVALDGVNTDYTDHTNTATISGSSNFVNTFKFATFYDHRIGGQFYWDADWNNYNYLSSTNPTDSLLGISGTSTTTKSSDEDHAEGTSTNTEYDTLVNRRRKNTFGIDFDGVAWEKEGDRNFYIQLNKVELALDRTYRNAEYSTERTLNGSAVGAGNQFDYSGEYISTFITPKIEFELGLDVARPLDLFDVRFSLIEAFAPKFNSYTDTYDTTTTNETSTQKTTTSVSYDRTRESYFGWTNTLTPRFDFDFETAENLTLKARVDLPVTLGGTNHSAYEYSKVERKATFDKTTNTTTYTTTSTDGASEQDHSDFQVNVAPVVDLGLVYQVKPGKFNLNMGAVLTPGSFSWTRTEKTNSDTDTRIVTTQTNAAGETTTTSVTTSGSNGDTARSGENNTADTKTNEFASDAPTAKVYLGGTWFLTDNVQLDMDLLTGTNTGTANGINWNFNIQFGFRY